MCGADRITKSGQSNTFCQAAFVHPSKGRHKGLLPLKGANGAANLTDNKGRGGKALQARVEGGSLAVFVFTGQVRFLAGPE